MQIFKEYGDLSCGVNDDGDLFLGDSKSGQNLPDTPENRTTILSDFDRYIADMKERQWTRYAVVITGARKPFYKVKEYDNLIDYGKDTDIMVSSFTNKEDALRECKRLEGFAEKHPSMVKTEGKRKQ